MLLIKISICFSYFIIGGLATTNILRLLKGSNLPVLSSECHCDNCGMKIGPLNQMPIVSFIACKGRCRKCGIKLPLDALLLEIIIFIGMTVFSVICSFSFIGVLCSFIFYEAVRIVFIIKYGKRENEFAKQYFMALLALVPFFLLLEFMALLLDTL